MNCQHCGFNIREAEEFYAKQNQAIQRELSESNEYARRLNLKIIDLCKERDESKKHLESACLDWAEDDTRLREMCLKVGIPQSLIDGDENYVPHITGLGELLVEKIESVTKERDALKEWIENLSFWEWNPSTEKMGTVEVLLDPQEFVYVGNRKPEGLK